MSTQSFEPKPMPSANLVQIGSSVEEVIQQRLAEERVRDVGAIAGRIAKVEFLGIAGRLNPQSAALESEELPGALEMGGAAQGAAGLEAHFIELDIFLEIQG